MAMFARASKQHPLRRNERTMRKNSRSVSVIGTVVRPLSQNKDPFRSCGFLHSVKHSLSLALSVSANAHSKEIAMDRHAIRGLIACLATLALGASSAGAQDSG